MRMNQRRAAANVKPTAVAAATGKSKKGRSYRSPGIVACFVLIILAIGVGVLGFSKESGADDDGVEETWGSHKKQKNKQKKLNDKNGNIRVKSQTKKKMSSAAASESPCTIWLAGSALQGHPGMGVYTTRTIPRGEKILPVNDGLTIPLYNFVPTKGEPNAQAKRHWLVLWNEYIWSQNKPDHISYENTDFDARGRPMMSSYAPCYSSLTNHHCLLSSLQQQYPKPFYDDTIVSRDQAGAGAMTYDIGRENFAMRQVEPGEELFLNYLYCEHDDNQHSPEWAKNSFMPEDFKAAKQLTLDLIWKSLQTDKKGKLKVNTDMTFSLEDDSNKLVSELLPKDMAELQEWRNQVDSITDLQWFIMKKKGLRPQYGDADWVRDNGICLENFIPTKTSAIMGRGGVAQWVIPKGDIVAPAPLLQIMDKEALTIYEKVSEEAEVGDNNWNKLTKLKWSEKGKQLLLNYCFGHAQSTLLLCPQSNVVLLNHCGKDCSAPNAEIRWASPDWHKTTASWLKFSLEELEKEATGGLAFDVIALRDIQPGEEVFIDYGAAWEQAWDEHVANYKVPETEAWITAKEANDDVDSILPEFISGDLRKQTEHPYLFTACYYKVSELDEHDVYQQSEQNWEDKSDAEIVGRFSDAIPADQFFPGFAHSRDYTYWPCTVISIESNKKRRFTVRITQSPFHDAQPWEQNNVPRLLTNYPRKGIRYIVRPGMSDQQMPNVFRHEIGIPDAMFPEQWKNLKN